MACPVRVLNEARERGYKDGSNENDDVLTAKIGEWEPINENGINIQVFREVNEITFTQSTYRNNLELIGTSFRGPSDEVDNIDLDPKLLRKQLKNITDKLNLLVKYAIDYIRAVKKASISLKAPPDVEYENISMRTPLGINNIVKNVNNITHFVNSIKYKRCDGVISPSSATSLNSSIKTLGINEKSLQDREKKYAEIMKVLFDTQMRLSDVFSGIASCAR